MKINTTIIVISVSALLLLASTAHISADKKDLPKETKDGLVLNEDAKVDIAYVRPNVDWKKYKTFYFRTLNVSDEAKDASPKQHSSRRGHMGESWIIPEKDIELMKTEFARIMTESMEDAGYTVVTEPQSDTLIIAAEVVDIYLKAPIEDSRKSYASRGATYTDGAGSMTIAAALADADEMRVLAYIADNRYPSSMWSQNTRISNVNDMKGLYRTWGKKLAKGLKKAQDK